MQDTKLAKQIEALVKTKSKFEIEFNCRNSGNKRYSILAKQVDLNPKEQKI
jgi:hypothetical protein